MSMNDEYDSRWTHGMDGWRVREYDGNRIGEITGYVHPGHFVWVVWDGQGEPVIMRWNEVRPA